MPIHDWTKVKAGTFHDFHNSWITHLKEALNGGLLPPGYYALSEQHAGRLIPDVLTLQEPESNAPSSEPPDRRGGLALAEAPPRVGRKRMASPNASYRAMRRSLAIRHSSGHRIVALVEILSPANKDRPSSVLEIVDKVESALRAEVHVTLIDLFPPGPHDPKGVHGALWERFDPEDDLPPSDHPLTLASYVAREIPEAYVEYLAVGDPLPDMPLFLLPSSYLGLPLEASYHASYHGMPAFYREILEGRRDPTEA